MATRLIAAILISILIATSVSSSGAAAQENNYVVGITSAQDPYYTDDSIGDRYELNYPGQDGRYNADLADEACAELAIELDNYIQDPAPGSTETFEERMTNSKVDWVESGCGVPYGYRLVGVTYTDQVEDVSLELSSYLTTPCLALWRVFSRPGYIGEFQNRGCEVFADMFYFDVFDPIFLPEFVHESRIPDDIFPRLRLQFEGNTFRLLPPAGLVRLGTHALIYQSGGPDIFDSEFVVFGVDIINDRIRVREVVDLSNLPFAH